MALIQVEMNQVNGGGTSDVIVPNAIANNDGTSSGFSQDANNVLKVDGTQIVRKMIPIITTMQIDPSTIDVSSYNLSNGDLLEIELSALGLSRQVYRVRVGGSINVYQSCRGSESGGTLSLRFPYSPMAILPTTSSISFTKGKVLLLEATYNNSQNVKTSSSSPIIVNSDTITLYSVYKIIE